MQISGCGLSDVGHRRAQNEDYFLVDPAIGLYLVCDGMGGLTAGEMASRTAAETLSRYIWEHRDALMSYDDSNAARERAIGLMQGAVREASATVFRVAVSSYGKAGMGTTLTALMVVGQVGVMAHVGDSRLYLSRAGQLHQLSDDHTMGAELLRRGGLTEEEVRRSHWAHTLTRALGVQQTVDPDCLLFDILPGDTLLLCTDGLTRYVSNEYELLTELAEERAETIPHQLVKMANDRGGRDNVTAVVVRAVTVDRDEEADKLRLWEVTQCLDTLRYVSLFQHLTMKELVKVMNRMDLRDYAAGDVIIREGAPGDSLFVILGGSLAVSRGDTELARLTHGTHFGEMALLNERPRSATVTAVEPSRLLGMERERFHELIRDENRLATKLLWSIAQVLGMRLDEASGPLYAQTGPWPIPPLE